MKFQLIRVEGKLYNLIGLYGGVAYLGKLFNTSNDVVKKGVIWEMQPFYWDHEINDYVRSFVYVVRYFKKDAFGRSQFKKDIGLC